MAHTLFMQHSLYKISTLQLRVDPYHHRHPSSSCPELLSMPWQVFVSCRHHLHHTNCATLTWYFHQVHYLSWACWSSLCTQWRGTNSAACAVQTVKSVLCAATDTCCINRVDRLRGCWAAVQCCMQWPMLCRACIKILYIGTNEGRPHIWVGQNQKGGTCRHALVRT